MLPYLVQSEFPWRRLAVRLALYAVGLWLIGQVWLNGSLTAQDQQFKDRGAKIKAVFVYKIIKYVGWPKGSFAAADSPIVIGVAGKHPITKLLQSIAKGRKVNNRPLKVVAADNVDAALRCHILFLSADINPETMKTIVRAVDGKPIMTIGETLDFPGHKGVLGMVKENNKIRLYLSLEKARAQGLNISSQLAKIAKVVALPPKAKPRGVEE